MKTLTVLNGEGSPIAIEVGVDDQGKELVVFVADADIDADGAPHAYHPLNKGLDWLANAKDIRGNFVGVLADVLGKPFVQGKSDPAPGYYISTTSYENPEEEIMSQRRYVNSEEVPFIAVPPIIVYQTRGVVLGCRCRVSNVKSGKSVEAIVADVGPRTKAGEVSMKLAELLGLNPDPKTGGTDVNKIRYEIWPGEFQTLNGKTYALQAANGQYTFPEYPEEVKNPVATTTSKKSKKA